MTRTASQTPYIPRGGLTGRVQRQLARRLGVTPLTVTPDAPLITVSFDDFPASARDYGAAALEARGWRGVFFATGGLANVSNHHGDQYGPADLATLADRGHEIGCHSFSHADASRLSPNAMAEETALNRDFLKAAGLNTPPRSFAFPYGEARPATKQRLLQDYRALRGVQSGINRGRTDRGLLKAVALDGGAPGLNTALAAIDDVCAKPGWLIFFGHDIRETPSDWGCTPAFFEAVLDKIAEACEHHNAQVLTMDAALDQIEGKATKCMSPS